MALHQTSSISINDTSFKIEFVNSAFNSTATTYSQTVKHNQLEWSLMVSSRGDALACFLRCTGNRSNDWMVLTNFTMGLKRKQPETDIDIMNKPKNIKFDPDSQNWGYSSLIKLDAMKTRYVENDTITLEVTVNILLIQGNAPIRRHNFFKESVLCDVVLKVEEKRFHVNKIVGLGATIDVLPFNVFWRLSGKNEKEITIKDVKHQEFHDFLTLMYSCSVEITAANVAGILKCADVYDIPRIREQCAKYLIETNRVTILAKLKYAQQYLLDGLRAKTLESIHTSDQLEPLLVDINSWDEVTTKGLLKKSVNIIQRLVADQAVAAPVAPAAPAPPAN